MAVSVTMLLVVAAVVVGVAAIGYAAWRDHERTKNLRDWARLRGWRYQEVDTGLPRRLGRHAPFNQGRHRYAGDIVTGTVDGRRCRVFDYHYETSSGHGNDREVQHHRVSVVAVDIGARLPHLSLEPETIVTRAWGRVAGDLDTESHAFNQAFRVDGEQTMVTTAMLNPQVMSYLLLVRDRLGAYEWQFNNGMLLVLSDQRFALNRIDLIAHTACQVLDRIPAFVFQDHAIPPGALDAHVPTDARFGGSDLYGPGGIPGLPRWFNLNLRLR